MIDANCDFTVSHLGPPVPERPNLLQRSLLLISGFAFPSKPIQGVLPKGMTRVVATRGADYFAA